MARRTKEDAEKTRESLLDAAERVFLRKGVAKASLEEIAAEAKVTRGAVYWHFDNKFSIFKAMYERVKLPMDAMFDQLTSGPHPIEGLKSMNLHVFNTLVNDERTRNVFTVVRLRYEEAYCGNSEYAQEIQSKRLSLIAKFTRAFNGEREKLAEGITPEFAATALHVFISGVFWDYLKQPKNFPLGTMAPQLVECFYRGIMR